MFLTEELNSDLYFLARKRGMPVSGLVREALVEYVAREKRARQTLPGFVASGRSGRPDTAERHEDLLWQDASRSRATLAPAATATRTRRRRR